MRSRSPGSRAALLPKTRTSRPLLAILALCLCAPSVAASDPLGETAAERILAVVDGMPVLLSEARLVARLKALDTESAGEALIDELLMAREASRLPQAAVAPEDIRPIARALAEAHPGLVDEVGEQGIVRLVTRQAAILRYVEFRFRPQVRISDEDVSREWAARAGGGPLASEQREQLRLDLERRELDTRVEAWVSELRRKARVRYNRRPDP